MSVVTPVFTRFSRLTTEFKAPLLQRLDLPLQLQTVNGSLFNDPHSIFREEPSPAVDDAWERVAKIGIFTVSSDEVAKLGKDPLKTVKAPESWGI